MASRSTLTAWNTGRRNNSPNHPSAGSDPRRNFTTETMNAQHSNRYTIGYDPVLTLAITNGIYKRRAKAESKARKIQAVKSILTRILTLNIRKP